MITIKHDNAFSEIQCSEELLKEIRVNCLSYMQEGAEHVQRHNPFWDGRIYLCTKKGVFASGLLPKLEEFLKEQKIAFKIADVRNSAPKIHDFKISLPEGMVPRYYQKNCVELSDKNHRGVFVMGTGAGKSLTSAMLVAHKGVDTLIIVPDTGLREQMSTDYFKWFGDKLVGTAITENKPIIVANIQALANKDKKLFERFKMIVVDEFHHAAAKTYKDVNAYCANAFYRYGFTGTFMRSDGSDMEMYGVLSNVIFTKTTSELIEEGFLVRPYISIMRIDLSEKTARGTRRLRLNYMQAYEFITKNAIFNKAIADIAKQKIAEGKQTLIVVRRIEHGELLHKMIKGSFYLSGKHPADYRRKVKKAFIDKRVRCLIATNIFGEGQDIPSIDVFINARAEKTEIQTAQGIGRALRKHGDKDKAEVFDFLIIGQKHLEDHSVERINSYRRQPAFKIQIKRAT